jgi:hypothetical protein
MEACTNISLLKKNEKLEDIDRQNRLTLIEVRQLEERILSILSLFLKPVFMTRTYLLCFNRRQKTQRISGKLG